MKAPFGIGLVPMTSTDDVGVNLFLAQKSLKALEGKQLDLVCFPENSLYFNFDRTKIQSQALDLKHSAFQTLAEEAKRLNCYLHLGGIPLKEDGQIYNSSVLIDPQGGVRSVYRKIHLFDVEINGQSWKESQIVAAGDQPVVLEIRGWKLGLSICYDLRFSELYLKYHQEEVDMILVPSSFTVPTGRAHWKTLLQARAIETQAYVVAPAQGGVHVSQGFSDKHTWGQSLLISPWGEVLAESASYDDLQKVSSSAVSGSEPLWALLDPQKIEHVRQQIPLKSHRRL